MEFQCQDKTQDIAERNRSKDKDVVQYIFQEWQVLLQQRPGMTQPF